MSLIVGIRTGQASVRVFNVTTSQDAQIDASLFRTILEKNMGLADELTNPNASVSVTVTEVQNFSDIGKHIMLTVESNKAIAYMLDTIVSGFGGDDKVKKFDGGAITDNDAGKTWALIAEGDIDPASPRTWPFLLFRRADIS